MAWHTARVWPFSNKKKQPSVDEKIETFWAWWIQQSDRFAAEIDAGNAVELADEIGIHVSEVEQGLAWELGPGVDSKHHLCLSAEGDAEQRVLTQRWLSRAPKADETWEYYPARQPVPDPLDRAIVFDDIEVLFSEFQIVTDTDDVRARVNIGVWHPAWPKFDEGLRGVACFVALDNVLGEDDVESWIGAVDRLDEPPAESVSMRDLKTTVAELRDNLGDNVGTILQGETEGGYPVFVAANLTVKRIDHLLFDTHYQITIAIKQPGEEGLGSEEERDELNDMEHQLDDLLGNDAVNIAHETLEGRRVIHLHASAVGPVAERIHRWKKQWSHDILVDAHLDPAWEILNKW